jgi:ubiquinone/menaquinone biosynthesis C-methylase UbiE
VPNPGSNRKPVLRLVLFLVCAVLLFLGLSTFYSFTNTLRQLDAIESERDQWQRPSDVLRALDLRAGNTVADLGSGSGYFTLKLAPVVGNQGQVLAADLRKLSLFFLWTRALLRGQQAVHVIVGDEDNPRFPAGSVDAVLICNTYHEFSHPELMLEHAFQALHAGGRLVIVDRAPRSAETEHGHDVPLTIVESELRRTGFEIVSRDDHFIDLHNNPRGDDLWWLVTARKP